MPKTKLARNLMTALAVLAAPLALQAGISGTSHDLSARGWGSTELCIFCHATHNANKAVSDAPLWNHQVSTAFFTVYSSPTLNASVAQPGGVSRLCLSCHDGTVAMDSFGNGNGIQMIPVDSLLGTDIGKDHPISFIYDSKLAADDGKLVTPVSSSKVDSAGILPLYAGKMECATCHDAHDSVNEHYLRMPNTGSALCLKCHIR